VSPTNIPDKQNSPTKVTSRIFLLAYVCACLWFWWVPNILYAAVGYDTGISSWTIVMSVTALIVFIVGYSLPAPSLHVFATPTRNLELFREFAYKGTIIWAFPAFAFALHFGLVRWNVPYGSGDRIPLLHQAVLYIHLFLGTLFIGAADFNRQRRQIAIAAAVTILPRLFISLHWGRFFLAQGVLPILLIALARGWINITGKRALQLCIAALFILFVPALTRGTGVLGVNESGQLAVLSFLKAGDTLSFLENNRNLHWVCPPLLVSLTAKVVPYHTLGVCTIDVGNTRGVPAALDTLLTHEYSNDLATGTGGNYLLELYLTGGITAIIFGTLIFACTCRRFIDWIGHPSLYAGIWAECLSRALLAPRGNLGYVYERVPSLLLATLLVILVCRMGNVLRQPPVPLAAPASD
jgi:hypothetical protein